MRKWVRQQFTSYVNCCLYLSVLLGLRGLNKQTERLQRADRNVLEHQVAVGRQRQRFDNRLGFFNRCGVHKEDHATGLVLAEPELLDLAVEIEPQSVGDFLRQDPLPLLVRERLGKQTQSKNLHDCSPCSCLANLLGLCVMIDFGEQATALVGKQRLESLDGLSMGMRTGQREHGVVVLFHLGVSLRGNRFDAGGPAERAQPQRHQRQPYDAQHDLAPHGGAPQEWVVSCGTAPTPTGSWDALADGSRNRITLAM